VRRDERNSWWRLGAPLGPGATALPSSAAKTPAISASPQATTALRIVNKYSSKVEPLRPKPPI